MLLMTALRQGSARELPGRLVASVGIVLFTIPWAGPRGWQSVTEV